MKKVLLLAGAAVAASLALAGPASSDPVWSGQCGIPAQQTVWGEYGWPTLLGILARPGTMLAVTTSHGDYPAEARARGAATYYFDVHMKDWVGTPTTPADPSTIEAAAERQYQLAVGQTGGCTTPLMLENELFGAKLAPPWTGSYAQYRADVLAFLQDLAAHGAHPVLLVSQSPYTGSTAAISWWLQVSQVADIVREIYIPATNVWSHGAVQGNRLLREHYRQAVADFTWIGIPASRLGLMVSFSTKVGDGGRNGLQPASSWFRVVKWMSLSLQQVAAETQLGSVFSWGWQEWNVAQKDPAKPNAACVWLWARDATLCDAPARLGHRFDSSRTEGQISGLPPGAVCGSSRYGTFDTADLGLLQALTGSYKVARDALLERLVEAAYAPVSSRAVLPVERTVVATSFGGSRSDYLAALQGAGATVPTARLVIATEIRRARLEQRRVVATPTVRQIRAFYRANPDYLVRRVDVSPAPPWLGDPGGMVLSDSAPQEVFSLPAGGKARVVTLLGTYTVRPLGSARRLSALPLARVKSAIVEAIEEQERVHAFERWTIRQQRAARGGLVCVGDELPDPSIVDLTTYLPFLRIQ